MMKMARLTGTAAVLALALSGCGGGEEVASCEDLADEVIDILQETLDEVGSMTMEDLTGATEEPEAMQDLEERMEGLESRAGELECSDEEMGQLVEARTDQLEAEGPVAELLLETIQSEGLID